MSCADDAATGPDPGVALERAEFERGWHERLAAIDPAVAAFFDPGAEWSSYAQAAALTGLGEGALRTSVCRTRKKLRLALAELLAA